MQVKHKVTGRVFTVSNDYFKRNKVSLDVLEEVAQDKPKRKRTATKKTKVVTEDTPVEVVPEEAAE